MNRMKRDRLKMIRLNGEKETMKKRYKIIV